MSTQSRERPETDLVPKRAREANADLLKLSQQGKSPVWVKVIRRCGAMNALFRDLEAPYRKGEPALVLTTESVAMAGKDVSCWDIEYHQQINGDYPKRVELPIEDYVWVLIPASHIGTRYCERDNLRV